MVKNRSVVDSLILTGLCFEFSFKLYNLVKRIFVMKLKVTLILLGAFTILSSSCKRYYDCQCTNNTGIVTKHVVNASNRVQASKDCRALQLDGNCELQ